MSACSTCTGVCTAGETNDADPTPIRMVLAEAGATLTGLRLLNGVLVLRIARGRQAEQVRLDEPRTLWS